MAVTKTGNNHHFLTKTVRNMSNISTHTNSRVRNSFMGSFDEFEADYRSKCAILSNVDEIR